MGMRPNPFAPRSPATYPVALERIKAWTREALQLDESILVSVTELVCHEEGCPPRETVVVALRDEAEPQILRVHKAMPDVRQADIEDASSNAQR